MKVIHHKQGDFFFIKADDSYFLDVQCSRSFFGYSIAIQLNDSERAKFKKLGVSYIETLASTVSQQQDAFIKRQVDRTIGKRMHDAIMAWNAENPRVQPPTPTPKPKPEPNPTSTTVSAPAPVSRSRKTPGQQLFLTTIKETVTPLLKPNHFRKKGYYYTRQFVDTFQTIHLQSSTGSSNRNKRFYINVEFSFDIVAVTNPLRRPEGFQNEFAGSLTCGISTRIRDFVPVAPDQWELSVGEDADDKPTRRHLANCLEQLLVQLRDVEDAYSYMKHPMFTESLAYPGSRQVNAQLYYMNDDIDLAWDMILQHTGWLAQKERVKPELKQPLHWTQRLGLFDLNERATTFSQNT